MIRPNSTLILLLVTSFVTVRPHVISKLLKPLFSTKVSSSSGTAGRYQSLVWLCSGRRNEKLQPATLGFSIKIL